MCFIISTNLLYLPARLCIYYLVLVKFNTIILNLILLFLFTIGAEIPGFIQYLLFLWSHPSMNKTSLSLLKVGGLTET